MNHVPPRLRKIRGAPLSKPQIEAVVDRANELANGEASAFSQGLSDAKAEFTATHTNHGSSWVKNGDSS